MSGASPTTGSGRRPAGGTHLAGVGTADGYHRLGVDGVVTPGECPQG